MKGSWVPTANVTPGRRPQARPGAPIPIREATMHSPRQPIARPAICETTNRARQSVAYAIPDSPRGGPTSRTRRRARRAARLGLSVTLTWTGRTVRWLRRDAEFDWHCAAGRREPAASDTGSHGLRERLRAPPCRTADIYASPGSVARRQSIRCEGRQRCRGTPGAAALNDRSSRV
jgi:hypothetical protein